MHFAQFFIWCLSKFRCLIYKVHAPFAEQYVIIHASQEMSSAFFKVFSVCHFFQFHHLKSDLSCAQCPHSLLFHLILLKNIILSALQNLPAAALDKLAAFPKTKCSLSSIKGVLIDESNRNCQTDRRPWPRCHSQGDPPHHEKPRGRPVTDNIGTVGKILLRHAGSVKKMGTGLYIVTEGRRPTVGIREG